jgi:hypothetical protein
MLSLDIAARKNVGCEGILDIFVVIGISRECDECVGKLVF